MGNNADGSSGQQCAHDNVAFGPSETRVYTCPTPLQGRYVRIYFGAGKSEYLQLCVVQVQGEQ